LLAQIGEGLLKLTELARKFLLGGARLAGGGSLGLSERDARCPYYGEQQQRSRQPRENTYGGSAIGNGSGHGTNLSANELRPRKFLARLVSEVWPPGDPDG